MTTNTLPKHIEDEFLLACAEYHGTKYHHLPLILIQTYMPSWRVAAFASGYKTRSDIVYKLRKLNRLIPEQYRGYLRYEHRIGFMMNEKSKSRMYLKPATAQNVRNMKHEYLIYAFGIDMKKKAWKETMNAIDFIRLQNIPVYEQYLT